MIAQQMQVTMTANPVEPNPPASESPDARATEALLAQSIDPMPAGRLGMWLFLASEAMFFIGLLSAFIVLGSAGSQHQLFVKSSQMLNIGLGCGTVITLLLSSVSLLKLPKNFPWLAVTMASAFIFLQVFQWKLLTDTHTIVAWKNGQQVVLNGRVESDASGASIEANQMSLRDGFDIHTVTAADFSRVRGSWIKVPPAKDILLDLNYGPSRNNYFACYFLMTIAHVVHLLAGMIALLWFMRFAEGNIPQPVQIYWHFVNAVGVIAFLALYFV